MGPVELLLDGRPDAVVAEVLDDADHAHPRPIRPTHAHAAAQGIRPRPVRGGQGLVDEGHLLTVRGVGVGEGPAAYEPLPERLERAVRRHLPVPLRVDAGRRHVALDGEPPVADLGAEGKRADQAGPGHARERPHTLQDLAVEARNLLRRRIAGLGQGQPRGEDAVGGEPEVHVLQRPQAAQHEPRAEQEHHRQRHLRHYEEGAQALAAAAPARVGPPVPQRFREVQAQRAQGGSEAEEEGRAQADRDGEGQDAAVDRRLRDPRQQGGAAREEQP